MKNISFDNPWLLLLAIPLVLVIVIPYFISVNKDNKTIGWKISLGIHIVIIALASLAIAGLMSTSVLTETTVYVVADVSYSSDKNLDEIDERIAEIRDSLPENSTLGVICFGKDSVVLTPAGRTLRSVSEANVDNTGTDIASALDYAGKRLEENPDTIKRIVLITDGNDTVNKSASAIASVVDRLTDDGVKVDAVFLDNSVKDGESEIQLSGAEYSASTYLGHKNEVKLLIQSSGEANVMLELYARPHADGENAAEFERIDYTVHLAESGLSTVTMTLPSSVSDVFDYKAVISAEGDMSEHNNTYTFTQTVVGRTSILLITGDPADRSAVDIMYGGSADIDSYVINAQNNRAPFTLEDIIAYDEIVISNVDIRDVRNANALIDSLDMAVSQYGKSLITFGDLRLQTDADDRIFKKFTELLPVKYGNSDREGRLYTIVLDVSHSMFMASKFTTAKQAAIKLLSVLGDDDHICLITFSGAIKVQTARKVSECRDELVAYIDSLTTAHGTDIGLGLEEALKRIQALKLEENHVMLISDGFSFDNTRDAVTVAGDLFAAGATVSAINTYIPADGTGGRTTLRNVVAAGEGGNYYEISSPERVDGVVFGTVANDIGDVIVDKDSTVNIVRRNDAVLSGITSLPTISRYIISMEKYDATVPVTVSYVKPNGYVETVPLYAYRSHGNGRVASFTSSISGVWTQHWSADDKTALVRNIFVSNTPEERIDRPFTITVNRTDFDAYIEITPSILDPAATVSIRITYPNGRSITRSLTFDSQKYFYTLDTPDSGVYTIDVTYSYDGKSYTDMVSFDIPYLPEYNAFVAFDTAGIYEFMRGNGTITVDGIPSLENDKSEIATYEVSYRIPLLIAATVLFVTDVLVRKLKLGKKKPTAKEKISAKEKANENV